MLLTSVFVQSVAFAADMQPLPPVTLPPASSVPGGGTPVTDASPSTLSVSPLPPVPLGQPSSNPTYPVTYPPISSAPTAPSAPLTPPSSSPPVLPVPASPVPPAPLRPSAETVLVKPTDPPPTTAVPEVSQPLRPVAPETISETAKKVDAEGIYFNIADEDIREVVKQISRALGKNFLLDDKLKGKITIISERKMTKDEVWEVFQSALDVIGFTIVQGPAGLLRIVSVRDALNNPIDMYTDETPFTDRFITRLITLKNISAADMANVIKGLVSKEGNLFAYPVTNTLIITDSGTNIDRLLRLINELDQEGPQEVLEIIPILYANAKDVAAKITQIYDTDKASTPTPAPVRRTPAQGTAEITLDEVPKLKKVIPDERTNAVIVLASRMAIQKVRNLIKKLDSPLVGDEGEVHVYYLKYANAKDMATVLTALSGQVAKDKGTTGSSTGGRAPAAGTPAAAAVQASSANLIGGAEFSGKFTVTADESTNALVITAGAKDFNTLIEQVIAKLDIPRRQVYVEAVIVEFQISENQQLGAGIFGGKNFNVGGNNLALFGSTFGFLDGGVQQLLNGTVGAASDQTLNVPALPGTGGDALQVPAFFSALQFAQSNTNANILSTPNILTLDNQEAEIKIGQKVPFPAASATTIGGSLQTTFTREDVALSLKIKPQISEGGSIRMEVAQEDREILDQQPAISSQAGPTTTERSIKTAIVVNNGQTVVLGGLIKDKYTTKIDKVPGLGDIPILGYLFKTRRKTKEKINLVVFLTPHIIREPRDFISILNRKIDEQNLFVTENFSKRQQKQIRKSLETHADYLLSASEGGYLPEGRPLTDDEKYPMSIAPSTTAKPQPLPPSKPSEVLAPATSGISDDESDLAPEKSTGRTSRRKAPPKKNAPESSPRPATPSDEDTDLAY